MIFSIIFLFLAVFCCLINLELPISIQEKKRTYTFVALYFDEEFWLLRKLKSKDKFSGV